MSKIKSTKYIYIFLAIVLILTALIKYPRNTQYIYRDADATWHTLLTLRAYDETPYRIHKFLPIVSLGGEDDKYIGWGASLPDKYGNYYYTSFSPAGFFLPYCFVKIFHLPFTEASLYIFNTLICLISALLWIGLISCVYEDSPNKTFLMLLAGVIYIFSPEILQGMGIVYWAHSLMQITLPLQLLAYCKYTGKRSAKAKYIFCLVTLLNPYIEWTGYVANFGYVIAAIPELFDKNKRKHALIGIFTICFLTVLSFALFVLHYLSVLPADLFFYGLKTRFFIRSSNGRVSISDLGAGYWHSYFLYWVLLAAAVFIALIKKTFKISRKKILFIVFFAVVENLIMMQHAVAYTYDRMKFVFVLSFLMCEIIDAFPPQNRKSIVAALILTVSCGLGNLAYYTQSSYYYTKTDYLERNKRFAEFIDQNYGDSVLSTSTFYVRGYLNLLFDRGIYENTTTPESIELAKLKGKRYSVTLLSYKEYYYEYFNGNMNQLYGGLICDTADGSFSLAAITDNGIEVVPFDPSNIIQ